MDESALKAWFKGRYPDASRTDAVYAMLQPACLANLNGQDPIDYLNGYIEPPLGTDEAAVVQELLQARGHSAPARETAPPTAQAPGVSPAIALPLPTASVSRASQSEQEPVTAEFPRSRVERPKPPPREERFVTYHWGTEDPPPDSDAVSEPDWPRVRQAIVDVLNRGALAELRRMEAFYVENRFAHPAYATAVVYISAYDAGLYETEEDWFLRTFHED